MRVTLNLASRPFTDLGPALKRLRIAIGVLAALCLLFLLGLHLFDREATEARARDNSLDGQIARFQAERSAAQAFMRRPDNAQLLQQTEFLNEHFDEKSFSWTLAMQAMETVLPAGVQVTAIEPIRGKDGHIKVHVRVAGPRDRADELVANLERSRRFLQPRIVGENAEASNGPGQRQEPISASNRFDFDLEADYNPPAPEERAGAARSAAKSGGKKPSPIPLGMANPKHLHTNPAEPGQPPGSSPRNRPQGGPQ
ncbi:MAG: fimbrial assembly protein [Terracidiphilus sp.]|jgi:type IV pilus assembly protein PilN